MGTFYLAGEVHDDEWVALCVDAMMGDSSFPSDMVVPGASPHTEGLSRPTVELLATCSVIRNEARRIFYRENTFVFCTCTESGEYGDNNFISPLHAAESFMLHMSGELGGMENEPLALDLIRSVEFHLLDRDCISDGHVGSGSVLEEDESQHQFEEYGIAERTYLDADRLRRLVHILADRRTTFARLGIRFAGILPSFGGPARESRSIPILTDLCRLGGAERVSFQCISPVPGQGNICDHHGQDCFHRPSHCSVAETSISAAILANFLICRASGIDLNDSVEQVQAIWARLKPTSFEGGDGVLFLVAQTSTCGDLGLKPCIGPELASGGAFPPSPVLLSHSQVLEYVANGDIHT